MAISLKRHESHTPETLFASPIHVIGVGGVGSNVVEALARMQAGRGGVWLYDNDIVEPHNPPNQAYTREHIGMEKVDAIKAQAEVWSDDNIQFIPMRGIVKEAIPLSGIVFLCVDNMATRRDVMENSVFENKAISLVIDIRIDALSVMVFAFDPNIPAHCQCWRMSWFPDAQAQNLAGCSGHLAIPTVTKTAANLAVQQAINFFSSSSEISFSNLVYFKVSKLETINKVWPEKLDPMT